ncbi:MAG: hypothetical protein ABII22_03320 [Candidatus Micrarchaeota archaeon]
MQDTKNFLFASINTLILILGLSLFNILGFSFNWILLYVVIAAFSLYLIKEDGYDINALHFVFALVAGGLIALAFSGLKFNQALFTQAIICFALPFIALKIRRKLVK